MNLSAYLDKQIIKHTFKQLLEIEPRIINASDAAKDVLEFLELEIAKCEEKTRLLRLLCLYSLTQNGIPKDQYALLTKEFVDAFGIAELLRILNLERAGVLKRKEGASNWTTIRDVPCLASHPARTSPSSRLRLISPSPMIYPTPITGMLPCPCGLWSACSIADGQLLRVSPAAYSGSRLPSGPQDCSAR